MSNRSTPHHKTVDIPRHKIAKGYNVELRIPHDGGKRAWQIVAAAPVNLTPDEKPPAENWVRVIVAPARVPQ